MKYLLFLLLLNPINLKAQVLKFDKRFGESENKWIAISAKDSSFDFGFVYVDPIAGFTLNYEGKFSILKDGTFVPVRRDTLSSMKIRLSPNQTRVAFIPETKFEELKIKADPNWLKYYKNDTISALGLYHRGYNYNGINECAKGLTYLEQAQKLDPNLKGLAVELAFSYNCLNQYDKAVRILQNAIEANPNDSYLYKELIYAQLHLNNLENAVATAKKALSECRDNTWKGEISFNVTHQFYIKNDKENFKYWAAETKKWITANDKLMVSLIAMETAIEK